MIVPGDSWLSCLVFQGGRGGGVNIILEDL